jgi:hypothetical protein
LHDVLNYPAVFRTHQNRFIELPPERLPPGSTFDETGFYQRSNVAKFFDDFCRYDALYVARDASETKRQLQELIRKAKRITEAFRAARGNDVRADTPTQLGIELTFVGKTGEPSRPTRSMMLGTCALWQNPGPAPAGLLLRMAGTIRTSVPGELLDIANPPG